MYLIINEINGYFEESDRRKYLTLVPSDERTDTLKKNEEPWSKIKNLIRSIANDKPDSLKYNYDEKYMKIKFNLVDDLSLKRTIEFYNIVIVVRFVFDEANKYYSQVFLD